VGRRIVFVILVVFAVAALFTAVSAGFNHAGYWGTAGEHMVRYGPGYYGGGPGFFPGFFLFPLILLLILAGVCWRPWHRHYWRYGYGPGRRSRGYWGPGAYSSDPYGSDPSGSGPYGPGPYGPGGWSGPVPGGPGAAGPGGPSGPEATSPGMGEPYAGPEMGGTTPPNAGARDAGLWSWLTGPRQVFEEWHRQSHAGAGAPQGHDTASSGTWTPPAAPPVPPEAPPVQPEAAPPVQPEPAPPVPSEASAPAPPVGDDVSPPSGDDVSPPSGDDVSPPSGEPPTPPQAPARPWPRAGHLPAHLTVSKGGY
jgi:hypothetical protein